jgi:hypothetical protein
MSIGKSVDGAEARVRAFKAEVVEPCCRENLRSDDPWVPVPQTDTGRRVEYTKAFERTFVKELGKLAP